MNEDKAGTPQKLGRRDIARLVLGVVLFGILMGIRPEFPSVWARALVAGCAGGVLALAIVPTEKRKS